MKNLLLITLLMLASCGKSEGDDTSDTAMTSASTGSTYTKYYADIVNLSSVGLAGFVELNYESESSGSYKFILQDMLAEGYQQQNGEFKVGGSSITLSPKLAIPSTCFPSSGEEVYPLYKNSNVIFEIPIGSEKLQFQEVSVMPPTNGSPKCL